MPIAKLTCLISRTSAMVAMVAGAMWAGEILFAMLPAQGEPLSGGAGWVGAGLLGAVLCWLLLKHLPDKDKQLEKLLTTKDDQMRELLASRDVLMESQLTAERESCEKRHQDNLIEVRMDREQRDRHYEALIAEHKRTHDESKEIRHNIADIKNSLAVSTALVNRFAEARLPENKQHPDRG